MPLFLVPGGHVLVPLEKTYMIAWEGVPARWRKVIDPKPALIRRQHFDRIADRDRALPLMTRAMTPNRPCASWRGLP